MLVPVAAPMLVDELPVQAPAPVRAQGLMKMPVMVQRRCSRAPF
jgi:hypothetical protein